MTSSRLVFRLICIFVLCAFSLSILPAGIVQNGVNAAPPDSLEPPPPGAPPEGLTAEEWQSVQEQIAAAEAQSAEALPAAPDADAVSSRLPVYLVAPLRKVINPTGAAFDEFGTSVDIDGEQMIVGDPMRDISGRDAQGAAYLFQRNRNGTEQWGLTKEIVAPAGLAGDWFGWDVTISGDVVAVGAPYDDLVSGGRGAVFIFYRNTGGMNNWGYVKTILGGGVDSTFFGAAVDLSSDKLIVGDPDYTLNGNQIGQAYIYYMNSGGVNNWGQVRWLGNANPVAGDDFGYAVAIDGDLCAVSTPNRDENGVDDSGAVYIFNRHSGGPENWGQIDQISAYNFYYLASGDFFGGSLALDRGVLVVGAPYRDSSETDGGAVFVFTPSSSSLTWDLQTILAPPSGASFWGFGVSVDKDGQFIVAGVQGYTSSDGIDVGAALTYQQNRGAANDWELVKLMTAVNGSDNDWFGHDVAISSDRIAIGAMHDATSGGMRGSVHVFAVQAQDWYVTSAMPAFASTIGSVSVYGDWLAVGLPFETVNGHTNQGAVNLYQRNQGGADRWQFYKQISLATGATSDFFGFSVALYADTLAVGAPWRDQGKTNNGTVTIFKQHQGGFNQWNEWANYNVAEDGYNFGNAVALHQDLLAIGAPGADISGKANQGIVWMCYLGSSGCASWKTLTASDGAAEDGYGYPLSLDNDILAVGSQAGNGAVYLHQRNSTTVDQWGQIKKLSGVQTGEDFGYSISLSGELLAVGSPGYDNGGNIDQGRVKIYSKNQTGADLWGELVTILDASGNDYHFFGRSVALYYDRLLVGAPGCSINGDGCVSSFRRNHAGLNAWGRFDRILGPTGSDLGWSLAIDGETAVVGGLYNAEVLTFQANYWMLARTATHPESDVGGGVGYSVALSGDVLVAGAPGYDLEEGAAYIFYRHKQAPDSWTLAKRLIAPSPVAQERFGQAVAVSGNWVAIGAVPTYMATGRVLLFERSTGGAENWGYVKQLNCPVAGQCGFGWSLSMAGTTLTVGGPVSTDAYIFYKDQGSVNNWGLKKTLSTGDWYFGWDVALNGDTLIVGAPEADVDGSIEQGAAYVYGRSQGGTDNWGQQQKLVANDSTNCATQCSFGYSVAVHEDTAVVGATSALANKGAAYVYYRDLGGSNAWGKLLRLSASDGGDSDWFGCSVAVYGDHILVGAKYNDVSYANQGSVYWYWRNYNGTDAWGQFSRILLPDGFTDDELGIDLAVWDDILIAGAPGDFNTFNDGFGAAHIFRLMLPRDLFLPLLRK